MEKDILCTVCPMGCTVCVEGEAERVMSVSGNRCPRGYQYASDEFLHPVRILTTTVRIAGDEDALLPVRSAAPIPKELLMCCMEEIRKAEAKGSIRRYDVVIENICNTGVDIVATGEK